jgi:tetratricopeptide (TPR) repeat protein
MTHHRAGSWLCGQLAALALLALLPAVAVAQQLPIRTALPSGAAIVCSPETMPGSGGSAAPGDAAGAERMIHAATQAMLLGDLEGALEFLDRALALDPAASEAIYLRARIHDRRGDEDAATAALCRYLAVDPHGPSAGEVHRRLDQARDQGAGRPLIEAYRRGLALEQEGRLAEAEAAFTEVVVARPMAAIALYNRGLVRLALGREEAGRGDLQRYLVLEPEAPDAAEVRRFIGPRAVAAGPPDGRTAFLAGALLPGGGQFYTGRPQAGVAVLGAVGAALAAGMLYERTTVYCLDADLAECPDELIASTETERPLLAPAIGIAAGVALGAAVEALMHVRRAGPSGQTFRAGPFESVRLVADGPVRSHGGVRLGLRVGF